MFSPQLTRFLHGLPPNARVLDVGCGTGKTINWLLDKRPDVSITALDTADVRSALNPAIQFHQVGVNEIQSLLEKESFDAIICQHVIEHLTYPTELAEGMRTVLKPGGKFFLETPNWTRLFIPFHRKYFWNDPTHVHPYSKSALRRLCAEYGFEAEELRSVSSAPLFSERGISKSERTSFLRSILQLLKKIPNAFLYDVLILVARRP